MKHFQPFNGAKLLYKQNAYVDICNSLSFLFIYIHFNQSYETKYDYTTKEK